MDITWLGHACVRLRTRDATVLADPTDRVSGFDMHRPTAEVVTISSTLPLHGHTKGVKGEFLLIEGPGEYEVRGVQLHGVPTGLRPANGESARNVAYVITAEDLRVAHLGGIGVLPTAAQAEELGAIDVLIVPIGAGETLTPAEAARAVRDLEPTIVIPVCYTPDDARDRTHPLSQFLAALGLEAPAPEARITLQRRALGETRRVLLLEPRGAA